MSLRVFQNESYRRYRSAPHRTPTCVVEGCDVVIHAPLCRRHRAMLPDGFRLDADGIAVALLHIEDGVSLEQATARIGGLT